MLLPSTNPQRRIANAFIEDMSDKVDQRRKYVSLLIPIGRAVRVARAVGSETWPLIVALPLVVSCMVKRSTPLFRMLRPPTPRRHRRRPRRPLPRGARDGISGW